MVSSDSCEGCGFSWNSVTASSIPARISETTAQFVHVVRTSEKVVSVRPSSDRWSILEYGAHTRDVLISIRERIIRASIEDQTVGVPIHRDERVNLGFYKFDDSDDVIQELLAMSRLFVRTFEALPPDFERRLFTFSTVANQKVTILWAGAQALHECEHHLGDVQENARLLHV
jgi:hypothetical protein